jgi:hypothetical protein
MSIDQNSNISEYGPQEYFQGGNWNKTLKFIMEFLEIFTPHLTKLHCKLVYVYINCNLRPFW